MQRVVWAALHTWLLRVFMECKEVENFILHYYI
jgi:hypothetical protein